METKAEEEQPLPRLRKDLKLFRGPDDSNGAPTFTIYDPVRSQYFKISWAEAEIIQHLRVGMTAQQLLDELSRKSTLRITLQELFSFFEEANAQKLLDLERGAGELLQESQKMKMHPVKAFLLYYLFFRIPLVNPDAFLTRTISYVKPLLSQQALFVYLLILLWGLGIVALQWDAFFSTFTQFFNLQGIIAYGAAIMLTKVIHELAHAYTAKKYGLRIPTMGVALLVLFPILYTDVTDAWKLASHRKRIIISGAGVIAELTIAGIATILWSYSEPGFFQSACFILASVNWLTSLMVNLNPAMRFDGYYLLMDWIGVENLQTRAFNVTRMAFYRVFLGMPMPDPEPSLSKRQKRTLIGYAIYTFVYRLFLYTAIALFVYFAFTKILGIFLFLVEVLLFFIWPVVSEITTFRQYKRYFTLNERSVFTIACATLLLLWVVVPLPHTLSFTATTLPVNQRVIYAPVEGKLSQVNVKRLDNVQKGQVLVLIESVELSNRLAQLEQQRELLRNKMQVAAETDKLRSYFAEQQAQLARVEAEYDGVAQALAQTKIIATQPGYVFAWDDTLRPGIFVGKDAVLGKLGARDKLDVIFFVPERDVGFLQVGERITFRTKATRDHIGGEIKRISPVRAFNLDYPELASLHHGDLLVTDQRGKYVLEGSYFPVIAKLDKRASLRIGEEGHVYIQGPWTSYLMRLIRFLSAVFYQELNA